MIPDEFQLKDCPESGSGVHRWIYGVACYCVDNDLTNEEAEPLIRAKMTRAPSPASEIMDALRSARREERSVSQTWDPPDHDLIKEVISNNNDPYNITTTSPSWTLSPLLLLMRLFPDNPLLCIGKTNSCFYTKRLLDWGETVKNYSLVVPSPMTAVKGKTKAGHMSAHSLANTGPRHYLVTEFDSGAITDQSKIIFHLAKAASLVLICFSGGKSLHAWWNVKDEDPLNTLIFMENAVRLGADPRTWLPSQFCRLPNGIRFETKAKQSLLYFNVGQI